jgi:hypothetical protein
MNALQVLSIQSSLSLVAFALIARWHVAPRLSKLPREAALVPLLWVHVFRYVPLALYATEQVDRRMPPDVAAAIGYGDLISGVAALIALLALRWKIRGALACVWIFSAIGSADLVFATYKAVGAQIYKLYLGWNWYILNLYVPMLLVSQVMIVHRLVRRDERAAAPRASAAA